jgi:hypothetical protein
MTSQSFFDDSVKIRDAARQKRKKARTTVSIPAEFLVQGQERSIECTVTDLGTGGLSINTRSTMYAGDRLEVRMRLGQHPVTVEGTVVRVAGKSVGVQFEGVSEERLEIIQQFIHTRFFDKRDPKKP